MINLTLFYLKNYLKDKVKKRKFETVDCEVFSNKLVPNEFKSELFRNLVYDYKLLKYSSEIIKKEKLRGYFFDWEYFRNLPNYKKAIYLDICKPFLRKITYAMCKEEIKKEKIVIANE